MDHPGGSFYPFDPHALYVPALEMDHPAHAQGEVTPPLCLGACLQLDVITDDQHHRPDGQIDLLRIIWKDIGIIGIDIPGSVVLRAEDQPSQRDPQVTRPGNRIGIV